MFDKFEVQGLDELEKKLVSIGVEMGWPILRKASREAMAPVRAQMKRDSPVDEREDREEGPHMRDKISMTVRKQGSRSNKNTAATTKVGPTKVHSQKAIAAEYGTETQTATPFIRSALFDNRYNVANIFKSALSSKLKEVSK